MRFSAISTIIALVLTLFPLQPVRAMGDAFSDSSNSTAVAKPARNETAQQRTREKKPWYKSRVAKYAGGGAGAGAVVGGLIGGGKGAAAGAAVGGGAGYIYHRKTRRN